MTIHHSLVAPAVHDFTRHGEATTCTSPTNTPAGLSAREPALAAAAPLWHSLAHARPSGATRIRYAQCWEDADVLLEALDVRPGAVCLSIASAGDNTLALLSRSPARVIAVDSNPAQLACLELRVAAYRELTHPELLELMGSAPSRRRGILYDRCRRLLSPAARLVWDPLRDRLERGGIGSVGRLERYFALFRRFVLPLMAGPGATRRLLEPRTRREREQEYARVWESARWRLVSRLFFSRFCLGRLGRDPACFRYADGEIAARLLRRMRHALTVMDPSGNPYLAWILAGAHPRSLPFSLRPENFEPIRRRLDRLDWVCAPLESVAEAAAPASIDGFNLSDVFEYMPPDRFERTLAALARAGRPGARLAYWNLLVPRRRTESLAGRLRPLRHLAARLHQSDRAFFYGAFVLEEVA